MSEVRQAKDTRTKILATALDLFHRGSFKGTSINQVVEQAGITKGALFYYFKGKNELGYAVVDECIRQHIVEMWVEPLSTSVDPITDVSNILKKLDTLMEECPEIVECGCPLNNLAQEMSAQDEVFRERLLVLYGMWEKALEKALRAGIDAGNVRPEAEPKATAAAIVAILEGSIGLIKVNRTAEYIGTIEQGLRIFLTSLRP
jgi:TetR/AcrR family transcriptional regulator, transcriptional repressor for nem operon